MAMAPIDITDQRFGKCVAKQILKKRSSQKAVMWLCECDCGEIFEASGSYLRRGLIYACKKCQKTYKRMVKKPNHRVDNPKYTIVNKEKTDIIEGVNGWLIYFSKQVAERIAIQKVGIVVPLKEAEEIVSKLSSESLSVR